MAQGIRSIRVNTAGVRRLLTDPGEPVARFFDNLAEQVATEARDKAPRGDKPSPTGMGPLRDNIIIERAGGSDPRLWFVTANVPYAFWVTEGTEMHVIPRGGKAAGKRLKFYWKRVGRVVQFREVDQGIVSPPSSDNKGPQPFLLQALESVVQRELGGSAGTILSI